MKTIYAITVIAVSIALSSCQGVGVVSNPDGSISVTYAPPAKPVQGEQHGGDF